MLIPVKFRTKEDMSMSAQFDEIIRELKTLDLKNM